MSYRLFASKPAMIKLGGRAVKVEAGDRLHLFDADAQRILSSPIANCFVLVTDTDPSEPLPYQQVYFEDVLPEFDVTESKSAQKEEDLLATPMFEDAKVDPVDEVYKEYAKEGDELLNSWYPGSDHSSTYDASQEVEDEEAELQAYFDQELRASLPKNYNWRSIVKFLGELELREPFPLEFVQYIREKYSSLAPVVAECNRILQDIEKGEG